MSKYIEEKQLRSLLIDEKLVSLSRAIGLQLPLYGLERQELVILVDIHDFTIDDKVVRFVALEPFSQQPFKVPELAILEVKRSTKHLQ